MNTWFSSVSVRIELLFTYFTRDIGLSFLIEAFSVLYSLHSYVLNPEFLQTNVYHYLTYLLEKLPNDRMRDEELDRLAPWNEEVKAEIERRANDLNQ